MEIAENIEKKSNKKIAIGAILGYTSLAISILSGLFFTPWIKQSVGVELYGIYTLALSILNLFLIDFGLSNVINSKVSKYRSEGKIKDEEKFLSATLKIYLFLDFLIFLTFVVVFFLIDYIYVGLTVDERSTLKIVYVILGAFSIATFPSAIFTGILKSYEEFAPINIISLCHRIIYVTLTAISLLLNLGIYAIVLAYAVASLVNVLSLYLFVKIKLKKTIHLSIKTSFAEIKEIISFSIFAFIVTIASRLIITIVPSVLGIVSDSKNIAVFGICSSIESYVYSFGAVMAGFFMPKISRIYTSDNEENQVKRIEELTIKVGRIQLVFIGLVVIGFISVGQDFINIWLNYDPNFNLAYYGIIFLILFHLIYVPTIVPYTAMMSNKTFIKPLSFCALGSGVINVGLVFLLGYFWGALGACISIFIAHIIQLVAYNILYRKYLKVSLVHIYKGIYLKFIPSLLLTLAVGLCLRYFLQINPLARFLITGITVVIVYLLTVWTGFGINETKIFMEKYHLNRFFQSFIDGIYSISCLFNKKSAKVLAGVVIVLSIGLITGAAVSSYFYPDFIIISSTEDFYKIAGNLDGNFVIRDNGTLSLPEDWVPVGTKDRPFTGTLDGGGVALDGFDENKRFVTGEDSNFYYGLIGYNAGTIKNIDFYLNGFEINTSKYDGTYSEFTFGQVCAYNSGTIENCRVIYGGKDIEIETKASEANIGLIAGKSEGEVIDCWSNRSQEIFQNTGTINAGLIGSTIGGKVEKCESQGNLWLNRGVDTKDAFSSEINSGGIVGKAIDTTITNCLSSIYLENANSSVKRSGKIVGYAEGSTISNCYSLGSLMNSSELIFGGIAGSLSGDNSTIKNCVSSLAINVPDPSEKIGQIVGECEKVDENVTNYFTEQNNRINDLLGKYTSLSDLSLSSLGWSSSVWGKTKVGFYLL